MREFYSAIQGSKKFKVIDRKGVYYYAENLEIDTHKTSFEFKGEVNEWISMVMGFKNNSMIMQRTMDGILDRFLKKMLWYI